MKKINTLLLGLLLGLLILASCAKTQTVQIPDNVGMEHNREVGIMIGNTAPDFNIESLNGNTHSFENKPVLLYFFATWCPYCSQDFSVLNQVYPEYENDVKIIAMDLDLKEDDNKIKDYIESYDKLKTVHFSVGDEKVLRDYSIQYTTTKYAIGSQGQILYSGSGAFTENQWRTLLELLKKN